jgi:hypothetical protein
LTSPGLQRVEDKIMPQQKDTALDQTAAPAEASPNPEPELVSMFVMSYNQADYIEATVKSAFAQTYANLEIILSDDGSTDGTFEIMQRLAQDYQGPHQVRLNLNPTNLGFIGHLNKIFDLSRGGLIVYAPGDDISHPDRCSKLYHAFAQDRPLLVHSDVNNMDQHGMLTGSTTSRQKILADMTLEDTAVSLALGIGATCAWHPDIRRLFGPIEGDATFDDLIFFFRATLMDRIIHVPEPLVDYRLGVGLSQPKAKSFQQGVAQERKNWQRAHDTYRQRLKDCQKMRPDQTGVIKLLQKKLEIAEYQLELFNAPFRAACKALLSRQKFKALLSMVNRLRKMTPKRQKRNLARAQGNM